MVRHQSPPASISPLLVLYYPALLREHHRPLPEPGRWQRGYRLPKRPSEERAYRAGLCLTARHYQAATGLMHHAKQEKAPERKSATHARARQAVRDLQWLLYQQIVNDPQWLSLLYRTGWG